MLKRIKKWITIDNCVDLAVDIFLIVWEVVTSPVLIVMRLVRHFIGEWFTNKIKACVRWVAHWFARKRAVRLEKGHGIFRTYWYLILPSPFVIIATWLLVMISVGIGQGYDELKVEKPNSALLKIISD